jgi:hypothetical protein
MKLCLTCGGDNRFYHKYSKDCRLCVNKRVNENRNRIARLQGYTGHYQKLKMKEYENQKETL